MKKLHIAILSSPGLGHLIPVIVLANRLATHHDVKVTVLAITTSSSAAETQILSLASGQKLVDILAIPPADISDLVDANTKLSARLRLMVRESLPGVRSTIEGMKVRPDVLVGDLFCTKAFSLAAEFNMPWYLYVTSNARLISLMTYCPILHEQIDGEYIDQTEPLKIPGCKPIKPEDAVDPMLDRNDRSYQAYLQSCIEFRLADGILVNTWENLEPITLEAFRKNESLRVVLDSTVYPIGPLKRPGESCPENELLKWLDLQPIESVLYVSFGSGGTLSAQQLAELAWGLESSQQRFIWVVRPPAENGAADKSFLTSGSGSDGMPDYLPEGFVTRTRNIGWVVPHWAPQTEILSHPSVGGFLTHCGWNSTLESITNGVPMIAWPLYAEQRLNATMLTEDLGVAVRPEVLPAKKVVEREEIQKMTTSIMKSGDGNVIRDKVKQVKVSGENAIKNGGSSYNAMNDFLRDAQMRLNSMLGR